MTPTDDVPRLEDHELPPRLEHMLEHGAATYPTRTAISYWQDGTCKHLSYAELDASVQSLAFLVQQHILALPSSEHRFVGIFLDHSHSTITALFSCLVAGAAYVPLGTDIKTPTFRSVLDETQLGVIITDSGHKSQLEELLNITGHRAVIIINISELDLSQIEPTLRVRNHLNSTAAAFVLFSSGTTGPSKGVVSSHRAVQTCCASGNEYFRLTSSDAWVSSSATLYASSLEEIFGPLSVGARLIMQPDYIYDDYSAYLKFLDDMGATAVTLITLVWHEFANYVVREKRSLPPSLRIISFGGEPATTNVWKAWRESVGEYPQVFNAYGSTETTIDSTIWEAHDKIDTSTLPIGRAHTGHTCYVLDPDSKLPVAPGEDGVLFVSGPGIAIGYLDKALTRKRFIPNPWAQSAIYERMYDTGDVVCQDEEGIFWFKGRLDLRVKVQGGRVELAGIETCLLGHPRVLHAAVIAVPDQNTHFLHAYIVEARGSGEKPLYVEDMMEYCRTRLEYWETPRRFFILEKLPHTSSQKVDRQLLGSLEPESLPVRPPN